MLKLFLSPTMAFLIKRVTNTHWNGFITKEKSDSKTWSTYRDLNQEPGIQGRNASKYIHHKEAKTFLKTYSSSNFFWAVLLTASVHERLLLCTCYVHQGQRSAIYMKWQMAFNTNATDAGLDTICIAARRRSNVAFKSPEPAHHPKHAIHAALPSHT